MPRISVVLPVYNGADCLRQALESILAQTLIDWELLVINEYDSNDGSSEIIREYAVRDDRIRLIQNTRRLGLAESLNIGLREAAGDFIARMDADDLSLPERFHKQTMFLDAHPEVGICGTWQRHEGPGGNWIHRPPADPSLLAANLLFSCELCHSTVMMRRSVILKHGLFYDGSFQAEDYELWTRALTETKLANIPEILGIYRYGGTITGGKRSALEAEHGTLCAAAMRRTLGLEIPEEEQFILNAWINIFDCEKSRKRRREMLDAYADILRRIWDANRDVGFFDETALLDILRARWVWAQWDLQNTGETAKTIGEVFAPVRFPVAKRMRQSLQRNPSPGMILQKIWNRVKW